MNTTIEGISRLRSRAGLFVLTFLLGAPVALAQGMPAAVDTLSGKYEGTAKTAGAADEKISLELKNDAGKVSGRLLKGETAIDISEGSLAESKLSLKLGAAAKDGAISAVVNGDKIMGDWTSGTQKRSVELTKVPAASAATASAAPVNLSGQWDAVADANGQPVPFLLTLKVEGENVTGGSSSQLGEATIKPGGSWKEGRLVIQLEGASGVITLNAAVIDGKLSGEFDYAGQMQGKWVAVRKN
jgi:hypothetical protein